MHSTTFLAALAGFMTIAAGSPAIKRGSYPQFIPVSPADVSSHTTPTTQAAAAAASTVQTVGVYVCTDADGLGDCAYILNIPGACTSLTGTEFNDEISFVDPTGNANTPNANCTVFIDENCPPGGTSEVIDTPYENLQTYGDPSFNDAISSLSCTVAT